MLLDNKNYRESGYVGEELLGGAKEELQQKCMAVQQSIEDGDFDSYEDALSAYGVSDADYKLFQANSTIRNIFVSFSGTTQSSMEKIYLQVFGTMFKVVFPQHGSHAENIVKEIQEWSTELEHQQ